MKKIIVMTALLGVVASPAFAGSGHGQRLVHKDRAGQAYAYVPAGHDRRAGFQGHFANPSGDVYVGHHYVGSDPDPRVRLELRREYNPTPGD